MRALALASSWTTLRLIFVWKTWSACALKGGLPMRYFLCWIPSVKKKFILCHFFDCFMRRLWTCTWTWFRSVVSAAVSCTCQDRFSMPRCGLRCAACAHQLFSAMSQLIMCSTIMCFLWFSCLNTFSFMSAKCTLTRTCESGRKSAMEKSSACLNTTISFCPSIRRM